MLGEYSECQPTLDSSSGRKVGNWEVSAHACSAHAVDFVLMPICATGAPFSLILLILAIEELITCALSMAAQVGPFKAFRFSGRVQAEHRCPEYVEISRLSEGFQNIAFPKRLKPRFQLALEVRAEARTLHAPYPS